MGLVLAPKMDNRAEGDLLAFIRLAAASYTPEWRFDEDHPDVGTALALIYADMFSGTLARFNQMALNNKIAFFNSTNAHLLPSVPATGYVTFGLAGDPESGVPVKAGTQLVADVEDREAGSQVFETVNDVCVTPAAVQQIYCVSGKNDLIARVWPDADAEAPEPEARYLFDLNGVNRQEHVLRFSSASALLIRGGAWVEIALAPHHSRQVPAATLEALLDEKIAVWEYFSVEGYQRFDGARQKGDKLLFFKSERQPVFAEADEDGVAGCWLRCRIFNIDFFRDLVLDRLNLSSSSTGVRPDAVSCSGVDENIYEFFPFGEKMTPFSELYIASEEALSKSGALVKLNFNLNFMRIPLDIDLTDPAVNWKLIMRRSEFKPDVEYDITIEDVLWEYFNGSGWARLFPAGEHRDAFSTKNGTMGQYCNIEFVCPEDMTKILVGSRESYYLRCRVLKLNNFYKTRGYYIAPYVEGPAFAYRYPQPVLPDALLTLNNRQAESFTRGDMKDAGFFFRPFKSIEDDRMALYFGFDRPLTEGPIKLLFFLRDVIGVKPPRLSWEYYGRRGWVALNTVDGTENLRKTGIVTFMGGADFQRLTLWAEELYWVRVVDGTEAYNDRRRPLQLPALQVIYLNATELRHLETRPDEYHTVPPHEENYVCRLLNPNVQEIAVYINETDAATPHLPPVWTRWKETEDLALSGPDDRHYQAERGEGYIRFGDGRHGRIPPAQEEENIRVTYRTGGGEIGNVPAGGISRSYMSLGMVNTVANPALTAGGCDRETLEDALRRSAAALKHGQRAVTTGDYEALALEANRNIRRAKCFANIDEQGRRAPGSVTLVILQKDFRQGRGFFTTIAEQVYRYVAKRANGNIIRLDHFHVVEPEFLELVVKVELVVRSFNSVFAVREQVAERLETFLHPLTGNFDGGGWEIGRVPNQTQILNSLRNIDEVAFLKNVTVAAFTEGGFGRIETDPGQEERLFALPLSGTHEIVITVEERS
jgi:hypothetical protein